MANNEQLILDILNRQKGRWMSHTCLVEQLRHSGLSDSDANVALAHDVPQLLTSGQIQRSTEDGVYYRTV